VTNTQRCYISITWGALQHEDPHCGFLSEPTVIAALYRHDPVNICQDPLVTAVRVLPVPPGLDESLNDEQMARLWTSDDYIESTSPTVWDARMETYASAQAHGYEFAYERWQGLDEIDLIDIAEMLAELDQEEEPAVAAVN
jgi:hypothetical protein